MIFFCFGHISYTAKRGLAMAVALLIAAIMQAQLHADDIRQLVEKGNNPGVSLQFREDVKQFYQVNHYQSAWLINKINRQHLIEILDSASELGLEEKDYQYAMVQLAMDSVLFKFTHADSLLAEARLTDAAIHFLRDVAYGNNIQSIGFNGLSYKPSCFNIPELLATAISQNDFLVLLKRLEPTSPGYSALKATLNQLRKRNNDARYRKEIEAVKTALNTFRWIRCFSERSPLIIVNIPSASLMLFEKDSILLESRVITGKRSTPTPTFFSEITQVVLYPYWMIPTKIATREYLPLIKRDIGYLDANGIQVLNEEGKIMRPRTINWGSLSPTNFPYTLRQSTGCDNSLGIIKFNFNTPYGVYLHDTPWKFLFNFNKRYFSHGCIRVEKAIELSHFLLKENSIAVDTLEAKGCLPNQLPIYLKVREPLPVLVIYNTAWVDSTATVRFNEDIYRKMH